MSDYISREAFLEEQRHLYCENCARRKGMKNGKMRFVYEIGDAPCRACAIMDVLDAVEDAPAADVRPVVKATWAVKEMQALFPGMDEHPVFACSECGYQIYDLLDNVKERHHFCPNCGADMREER